MQIFATLTLHSLTSWRRWRHAFLGPVIHSRPPLLSSRFPSDYETPQHLYGVCPPRRRFPLHIQTLRLCVSVHSRSRIMPYQETTQICLLAGVPLWRRFLIHHHFSGDSVARAACWAR